MEFFLNNSEIDFLIFLYLKECGFNHSNYVFEHEANLKFSIDKTVIFPPGSLVSLLQRGFVYSYLENEWFLKLRKNKKNSIQNIMQRKKTFLKSIKNQSKKISTTLFISSHILHQKSVLFCTWHPRKFQGYYSVRNSFNYLYKYKGLLKSDRIFNQYSIPNNLKKNPNSYEITSIDFNVTGTLISTIFYNGLFMIWSETGILLYKNYLLNRALIESKWNESSRNLTHVYLTGEIGIWSTWYSQTILVVLPHRSLLINLEWTESESFITSSKDNFLSYSNLLGKNIQIIKGHNLKINDFVYSNEKKIIGTCSDDLTIKLWKLKDKMELWITLKGHQKEIMVVMFRPYCFKKINLTENWIIISGSFDFSIRIWDLISKNCLKFLKLDGPVISIEWDNLSEIIAIGTSEKIYTLNYKNQIKEFNLIKGGHGIFSLLSHSFVNKFLGFSTKQVFLV